LKPNLKVFFINIPVFYIGMFLFLQCLAFQHAFAQQSPPAQMPPPPIEKKEKPKEKIDIKSKFKTDTLFPHSPFKASLMSAVIPGLGQVYNRKYWKVPIVFVGMGAGLYYYNMNRENYHLHRNAYLIRQAGGIDQFYFEKNNTQLKDDIENYRGKMELSVVITSIIYVLNIVDASVDGHLFYFDVSDNLAFKLEPKLFTIQSNLAFQRPTSGISLKFYL
jgi:hypothetical protein